MKSILIKASLKFRVKEIDKGGTPVLCSYSFWKKRGSEWKEKYLEPTTLITGSRATRSWNAIRNVVAKYFRDLNVIVQSTSSRRFCVHAWKRIPRIWPRDDQQSERDRLEEQMEKTGREKVEKFYWFPYTRALECRRNSTNKQKVVAESKWRKAKRDWRNSNFIGVKWVYVKIMRRSEIRFDGNDLLVGICS